MIIFSLAMCERSWLMHLLWYFNDLHTHTHTQINVKDAKHRIVYGHI